MKVKCPFQTPKNKKNQQGMIRMLVKELNNSNTPSNCEAIVNLLKRMEAE